LACPSLPYPQPYVRLIPSGASSFVKVRSSSQLALILYNFSKRLYICQALATRKEKKI
jgi:hypothetical protein